MPESTLPNKTPAAATRLSDFRVYVCRPQPSHCSARKIDGNRKIEDFVYFYPQAFVGEIELNGISFQ